MQLPFADGNAVRCVLYMNLERVLMRFEELPWLGPPSGPVRVRDLGSDASHAYGVRSDKIDDRLLALPVEKKLATSTILHRELERVISLAEECHFLRRHPQCPHRSTSQLRWHQN